MAVPVISAPATSDNNITTSESTIFTVDIANAPTYVSVRVNGVDFAMTLSAGTTYTSGSILGSKIGTVAAGTILFTAINADGTDTDISLSQTVTASTNKTTLLMAEILADLTADGITASLELEDEKTEDGVSQTIRTDIIITCTDKNGTEDVDAIRTSMINNASGWTGVSATDDAFEWEILLVNDTQVQVLARINHT